MKMKLFPRFPFRAMLTAALLLAGVEPSMGNSLKIEQFISPETCGDCHTEIYDQWKHSMHNLSHDDPLYIKVSAYLLKGLTDTDEIAEGESCVKCHTPVGNITGYPEKSSDDRAKVAEIATKGIQCDYCHSATGVNKPYNNGMILNPGNGEEAPGVKRGPRQEAESDFHDTAFSEFHTRSEICGTCHNVKHVVFKTDLETTYDEWKKSPYYSTDPAKAIDCQDCHMYQKPGIPATGSTTRPANPGASADGGPSRPHIFTHYFVGGNAVIPGKAGDGDKNKLAEERLAHAATLSIQTATPFKGEIDILVKNSGAGHNLPTGLTDTRQMWLEVKVVDEKGKTVFKTGELDGKGYLPADAIIYQTVFGDGRGNKVTNIAKAREILKDKRIPPLKTVKESLSIPIQKEKALTIKARLLYRSASQELVDTVLGADSFKLPVIVMAEAETQINHRKGKK